MKVFLNLFSRPGLIFCAFIVVLSAGITHATQLAPAIEQTAQPVRSLSGNGENYEVILKYSPFTTGSDVSLTAYVLDKATNEPIQGASLSGSMSAGSESLPCVFTETSPSIAGAYHGTIRVVSDEPYSWLFDISHGDKNDLIAIDGFKTGDESKGASAPVVLEPKEISNGIKLTVAEIAAFITAFVVLQIAIFFFMRKRISLTASAKDPR
jgi:hypothetical protein